MPTTLPNGIEIVNATPHVLVFWSPDWKEEVRVESDTIINARPLTRFHSRARDNENVVFSSVQYVEKEQGREILDDLRKEHPNAIIVGSILAAQAYPEEVCAPVPYVQKTRDRKGEQKLNPYLFTIFSKENENGFRSCEKRV